MCVVRCVCAYKSNEEKREGEGERERERERETGSGIEIYGLQRFYDPMNVNHGSNWQVIQWGS